MATVGLGIIAILLGILFEKMNAFLVGLTFGIAAVDQLPGDHGMYWKGLTTKGAIIGGFAGLVCALVLVILSPAVWVTVLGHAHAIFPYDHPALLSMPLAFPVIVVVSGSTAACAPRRSVMPSPTSLSAPRPVSVPPPLPVTDRKGTACPCGAVPVAQPSQRGSRYAPILPAARHALCAA
jgi:Na+/proline symporter